MNANFWGFLISFYDPKTNTRGILQKCLNNLLRLRNILLVWYLCIALVLHPVWPSMQIHIIEAGRRQYDCNIEPTSDLAMIHMHGCIHRHKMNAVLSRGRVTVKDTKITISRWEIIFLTNPRSWEHYMGSFVRKKILVNICWPSVDLGLSEFQNVLKNGCLIETWGLFLIMGLGVWYFGEKQPKHICFDPPYR